VQKSKTRLSFHQQPWQTPENLKRLKKQCLKIIKTETFCCGYKLNSSIAYSGILIQDTMLEGYFGLPRNKNTHGNVSQSYSINSKDLTTVSVYTEPLYWHTQDHRIRLPVGYSVLISKQPWTVTTRRILPPKPRIIHERLHSSFKTMVMNAFSKVTFNPNTVFILISLRSLVKYKTFELLPALPRNTIWARYE